MSEEIDNIINRAHLDITDDDMRYRGKEALAGVMRPLLEELERLRGRPAGDSWRPVMECWGDLRLALSSEVALAMRIGDFLEWFHDDARRVAKVINIAVTKRQGVPMCGVPYHMEASALRKLADEGVLVSIASKRDNALRYTFERYPQFLEPTRPEPS